MSKVVTNMELVEVSISTVPASGSKYYFPLNRNVQKGKVYAVELVNNTVMPIAPSGATNVGSYNAVTTIKEAKTNNDKLSQMSNGRLDPSNFVGQELLFEPFDCDIQNSFIQVTNPASFSSGQSFVFLFYYINLA